MPLRRYRTPHTVLPAHAVPVERQVHRGGHQRRRRRQHLRSAVRHAIAPRCDARSGQPRSSTCATSAAARCGRRPIQPTRREPSATPRPSCRTWRRSTATTRRSRLELEIAVSPEHDVEVRVLQLVNHSERVREIDVTSYVEVALAQARDDFAHPAFGKLFIETEFLAERGALICHRRPRDCARSGHLGGARPEPRRPAARSARMGNRSRALHRPRPHAREPDRARRPAAVGRHRLRARSDPQPAAARAPAGRRIGAASASRPASRRIAKPPRRSRRPIATPARRRARFALALGALAQPAPPHGHLERRCGAVRAAGLARARRRRLAARAGGRAGRQRARAKQPVAARHLRRPADPARARRRRRARHRAAGARGAGILAAEGPAGRPRDPQRASGQLHGRGAVAPHLAARRRPVAHVEAPARRRVPAARPTRWARPSARCSTAVASAVLETSRGDLRAHLARPPLAPLASQPLAVLAGERSARAAAVAEHERGACRR